MEEEKVQVLLCGLTGEGYTHYHLQQMGRPQKRVHWTKLLCWDAGEEEGE